jgi:hypothetical protein
MASIKINQSIMKLYFTYSNIDKLSLSFTTRESFIEKANDLLEEIIAFCK